LEHEVEALQLERSNIRPAMPIVLMIVGGASATFFLLPGIAMLAAGSVCPDDFSGASDASCSDVRQVGTAFTLVGAAGSVLGVVGLVMLVNQGAAKRDLDQRIVEKQREIKRLDVGVSAGPHHAGLRLTLAL
jgi:hypothetical protein